MTHAVTGRPPLVLCSGTAVVRDLGLWVAEVDGVVQSVLSTDGRDEALALAVQLGARSITVVETGAGRDMPTLVPHERAPDGVLPPDLDPARIYEVQLADTLAEPGPDVRDECMTQRQLPGHGHGELRRRIAALAELGPLPPIGVEVFGAVLAAHAPTEAARLAFEAANQVLDAAGLPPRR
ncbi:MAG: hypothetical protein HKN26_14165 [Acidimicrobiales bacterium]|nr:hypothetical protein [Acidimicrobiales bacterium]